MGRITLANQQNDEYSRRDESSAMKAYCLRCRQKTEIKNPEQVTLKNGRLAVRGVCSVCGMKVFTIAKRLWPEERQSDDEIRRHQREQLEAQIAREQRMFEKGDETDWPPWPSR